MHERMNRQNSWGLIPRTNSDRKTVPRNGSMCVAASLLSSLVVAAECSLVAAALNDDVEHFVCGVIITTATTAGSGSAMKDGGKNAASAGGNKDVTFVSATCRWSGEEVYVRSHADTRELYWLQWRPGDVT